MKKQKKVLLIVLSVVVAGFFALMIFNWDATTKAAKDAWEGKYEPPSAVVE